MKSLLNLIATLIASLVIPAAAFAGPTENITGCQTVAVEGSNYTVRADVTCALPETGGTGSDGFLLAALSIWADQRAEEAAED